MAKYQEIFRTKVSGGELIVVEDVSSAQANEKLNEQIESFSINLCKAREACKEVNKILDRFGIPNTGRTLAERIMELGRRYDALQVRCREMEEKLLSK